MAPVIAVVWSSGPDLFATLRLCTAAVHQRKRLLDNGLGRIALAGEAGRRTYSMRKRRQKMPMGVQGEKKSVGPK